MRFRLWIIILLTLLAVFVDLPRLSLPKIIVPRLNFNLADAFGRFPLKLGLDLQGGSQLVLQTQMDKIASDQKDNALESAREVIERRVNLYGVSESVVQA